MKYLFIIAFFLISVFWAEHVSSADEIVSNTAQFTNAPSWLTAQMVERVVENIQRYLEWDIRKINVVFYNDPVSFQKVHGFGSSVLAVTLKDTNTVCINSTVTRDKFEAVFGHELVHVILYQKFKLAIPAWLEEGLASYIPKERKVDYKYLNSQPRVDVRTLIHPFLTSRPGISAIVISPEYHYQTSTALIEMIASKCSLKDLLQLSVGEKLEKYLSTFCEIKDVNADFQAWLKGKQQAH